MRTIDESMENNQAADLQGDLAMETHTERNPEQDPAQAAAHIAGAHQILKALQERLGEHPEIGAAITKLEMALNILAIKTGGVW
jgi:hypothetical protein